MDVKETKILYEPMIAITCAELGWTGELPRLEKLGWFWRIIGPSYWKYVAITTDIQKTFQNIITTTREVIRNERSNDD